MKQVLSVFVLFLVCLASSESRAEFAQMDAHLFNRRNYLATRRTADQLHAENLATLQQLGSLPLPSEQELARANRAFTLTYSQAAELYTSVATHPIASLNELGSYDPSRAIGFCFGRAMTAHLESLYRGVAKDSIKKLWVVGDMRSGGTSWAWHVTTIVRGEGPLWYAIDPIMGYAMTTEQWYGMILALFDPDQKGQLALFVTEPSKFGPTAGVYQRATLEDLFYNQYFKKLLRYYREHGASGPRFIERRFKPSPAPTAAPTASEPGSVQPLPRQ